jgi:O-antigen ligase
MAAVAAIVLLASGFFFAQTKLDQVRDGLTELIFIEGIEGNSRWDLWQATLTSWQRAPILGSGAGSYRHVIAMDKPATGSNLLHYAHNDWLEWMSTTGVIGLAILLTAVTGLAHRLRPSRLRRLRFEYRYALAAAATALLATTFHEAVDFGLQIPVNRYLAACWIGLTLGVLADRPVSNARIEPGVTPSTSADES